MPASSWRPAWRATWWTVRAVTRTWRRSATTDSSPAAASSSPLTALLLRDYQEECIQTVLQALREGQRRVGISLATGAGKTVVFTQLLGRMPPTASGGDQTLILAHRRELVEQAARHCTAAHPQKQVEIEMGGLHASGTANITVASVRSLTSGDRLAKFDPGRFKLVLVDEAHHIVAPGYMQVLRHFGLDKKPAVREAGTPPDGAGDCLPVLVGVSATFSRFDGLALGAAIDSIVYHKDYIDMIGRGWLADVIFSTVRMPVDLSRVRHAGSGATGRDFHLGDLGDAINTEQTNEITVRAWLAKAAGAGRRSTLVFCVDLAHVAALATAFRTHGIDARAITGDTDPRVRAERLDAFRDGQFPVLLNCGVFTEGTDIPNIDCVLLARPTKSRNLLVQMIGRGMRLHPAKTNCHVIDMVASLDTGITTTPTLFGLDPDEMVDGASVTDLRALRDAKNTVNVHVEGVHTVEKEDRPVSHISLTHIQVTDYGSVLDLIADTAGDRHIRLLSQHAWVQVGRARYVLSGPTGTFLRIEAIEATEDADASDPQPEPEPDPDAQSARFRVVEVRALPPGISKSPFAAPRELCQVPAFDDAVRAADTYAAKIFPRPFVHRKQAWRHGPPSQGQLDFLNKLGAKSATKMTETDITRGDAADMITKLKHGARGWFADIQAVRRRKERKQAALNRKRSRESVVIGPLAA